jgi:hypothetical protein
MNCAHEGHPPQSSAPQPRASAKVAQYQNFFSTVFGPAEYQNFQSSPFWGILFSLSQREFDDFNQPEGTFSPLNALPVVKARQVPYARRAAGIRSKLGGTTHRHERLAG